METMLPVYLLFLLSGLTIYAVSSWMGEALLGQIKNKKTSLFGRATNQVGEIRAMYVPPAQISTMNSAMSGKKKPVLSMSSGLPPLPSSAKFEDSGWDSSDGLPK